MLDRWRFFVWMGLFGSAGLVGAGCSSTPTAASSDAPRLFPSMTKAGVLPSPELETAASMLCSVATEGAVSGRIDRRTRMSAGVVDGQLTTFVVLPEGDREGGPSSYEPAMTGLLEQLGATHAGVAVTGGASEGGCLAMVGARRLVVPDAPLPDRLEPGGAFPLTIVPAEGGRVVAAEVFLLSPGGRVSKEPLSRADGSSSFSTLVAPAYGEGRYLLEVMVDVGAGVPEVAILWPFQVGDGRLGVQPPYPEVLFPDRGHDDIALGHRAEALVQRLRTQQEIDVFRVAPQLVRVAGARADVLRDDAALGHDRPSGRDARADLAAREPGFRFVRLGEVQAQAGTLEDAWKALLRSPAHRYELVHPHMTHFGTAVRRGRDAAGRTLITLEVLTARKLDPRRKKQLEVELLGKINLARHANGLSLLSRRPALDALCQELAGAMAERGVVEDSLLGQPVGELALERAEVREAQAQVAALDDPLRLSPSGALMRKAANALGVGVDLERAAGPSGRWMVCVIAAEANAD